MKPVPDPRAPDNRIINDFSLDDNLFPENSSIMNKTKRRNRVRVYPVPDSYLIKTFHVKFHHFIGVVASFAPRPPQ